ncbi:hypothetical protein NQ317_006843 [Molorchus minor]|uniref:Uncharacterized protein n=1 Tax=Molorchus minor TaxID=1323400 RepID=A0ABQ9K3I1_9CUCU|nr:hypothetical protein NQ317_006843 [Molorchus minor]
MEKDSLSLKFNGCITCDNIKNCCIQEDLASLSTNKNDCSESPVQTNSTKQLETESTIDQDEYDSESFEEDDNDSDLERNFSFSECSLCTISDQWRQWKSIPNKTFSTEKIRNIDRENEILMNKILSNSRRVNQHKTVPKTSKLNTTSAAINRKKNQDKIARDNQILLRKIQSVKSYCATHKAEGGIIPRKSNFPGGREIIWPANLMRGQQNAEGERQLK